jgi:dienelactone hydrolase
MNLVVAARLSGMAFDGATRLPFLMLPVVVFSCGAPQPTGRATLTERPLEVSRAVSESTCLGACEPGDAGFRRVVETPVSFDSHGDSFTATLRRAESGDPQRLQPGVLIVADLGILDESGLSRGGFGFRFGREFPVYQVLAEALAQSDMAVLSYDKRTCVQSKGTACHYPSEHLRDEELLPDLLLDDARQALSALASVEGVDRERIFVLGHGRGADLALNLLGHRGRFPLAGLILISPPDLAPHQQNLEEIQFSIRRLEAAASASRDVSMADVLRIRVRELREQESNELLLHAALDGDPPSGTDLSGAKLGLWTALRDQHIRAQGHARTAASPILFLLEEWQGAKGRRDRRWMDCVEGREGSRRLVVPEMTSAIVSLEPENAVIPEALLAAISTFVF